jgi:outer membrane protein OmpA-like peptidoglycan-associated protein
MALVLLLGACATQQPAAIPEQYLVFFNFDSAALTDETRTVVRNAAANAKVVKPARIEIAGYTGQGADARTADQLATQRFVVVENALVAEGIDRTLLTRTSIVDPIPLPAQAVRRVEIRFIGVPEDD